MKPFLKNKTKKKGNDGKNYSPLSEQVHKIDNIDKTKNTSDSNISIFEMENKKAIEEKPIEPSEVEIENKPQELTVEFLLEEIKKFKDAAQQSSEAIDELKANHEKELEKALFEKDLEMEELIQNLELKGLEMEEVAAAELERNQKDLLDQKTAQSQELSDLCNKTIEAIALKDQDVFNKAKAQLQQIEEDTVRMCTEVQSDLVMAQSEVIHLLDQKYQQIHQMIEEMESTIRNRKATEAEEIAHELEAWEGFVEITYKEKSELLKAEIEKMSEKQAEERAALLESLENARREHLDLLDKDKDDFSTIYTEGCVNLENVVQITKSIIDELMDGFNKDLTLLMDNFSQFSLDKEDQLKCKIEEADKMIKEKATLFEEFIAESDTKLETIKSNYTLTMNEWKNETDKFISETSKTLDKEMEVKEAALNALITSVKKSEKELDVFERKSKMKALKQEKRALLLEKYKLKNVYVRRTLMSCFPVFLIGVFCLFFSILGSNIYRFQAKSFINSCLNKVNQYQSYKVNHMIYMDGLDFDNIGQLNDYTLYIENNYNGEYNENSDIYTLEASDNQFEWERFVRNELKVIKTPYEPQYIQVENFKNYGFDYDRSSVLNKALDNYVSKLSRSNFKSIQKKENKVIGDLGLSGYFSYYLTPSENQTFFYTLESKNANANAFFKDLVKTLSMDASYKSFLKEEQIIQSKLGKEDVFIKELDNLLALMIKDVSAESVVSELTFNQKGELISSDITFTLKIKGSEKPFTLSIMSNYSKVNEPLEIEKDSYTINSMKYNEIFPRVEQDEFTESESIPVIENISTLKAIEKNDDVNFNPTSESGEKTEKKTEEIEVLDVEVETDIDLKSE